MTDSKSTTSQSTDDTVARATLATALADADAAHAAALVTLATALAEAEATYATAHRTAHAAYAAAGARRPGGK